MKNSPAQKISAGIYALLEKNSLLPFFIMYMCKNRFYSTLKNALKNKNTMFTGGTCEREREVGKKEMVKKVKKYVSLILKQSGICMYVRSITFRGSFKNDVTRLRIHCCWSLVPYYCRLTSCRIVLQDLTILRKIFYFKK